MGAWSVTLYGNDASADIRDRLREVLRTPMDGQAILDVLGVAYPNLNDKSDEEYSDLWLALADQFHSYGLSALNVLAVVAEIIDSEHDLKAKRSLGMDERDLAKRAKLLKELRQKWAKPHPKPVKRKIQAKPDPFLFEAGDCVSYPVTNTGRTINPYFATVEDDPDWAPFGYGAMAVLARGHYLGTFAWYAVARLNVLGPDKPTREACAAAMIEAQTSILGEAQGTKPDLCIFASRATPLIGRKMRFEARGRLRPNDVVIREDLAECFKPGFVPGVCLSNELSGFGKRQASSIPISRYLIA